MTTGCTAASAHDANLLIAIDSGEPASAKLAATVASPSPQIATVIEKKATPGGGEYVGSANHGGSTVSELDAVAGSVGDTLADAPRESVAVAVWETRERDAELGGVGGTRKTDPVGIAEKLEDAESENEDDGLARSVVDDVTDTDADDMREGESDRLLAIELETL